MSDLISRVALIESLKKHNKGVTGAMLGKVKRVYDIAHSHVIEWILLQPTVTDQGQQSGGK